MTRHLNEAVRAPPRALPPSLAHIFGYHKEELLARYAAREAEPLYFELDSIVFFINDCRRGFPLLQAPAGAAARALSRANPEARRDACVVARLLAMSAVAPSERDGGAFPVTCRGRVAALRQGRSTSKPTAVQGDVPAGGRPRQAHACVDGVEQGV